MKCKPYSEITVEIGTQLKTVKITSNIFAVQSHKTCPANWVSGPGWSGNSYAQSGKALCHRMSAAPVGPICRLSSSSNVFSF